jgi:HSP20 family molecular chaperone IbpA
MKVIKEKNYLVKECYFGPFEKEIILPKEVDTFK